MPKKEIELIDQKNEIFSFFQQTHISRKNVSRLKVLAASSNEDISKLANIVLEVSQITPYKKRRLKILAHKRAELLKKLEEASFIIPYNFED